MSSSDAQPPLSRRQARERERAANAGALPATPPPSVVPASESSERRRPGSHAAPAMSAPAQSGVPSAPPASATEIVPGSGGLTRRQMRQLREAQEQAVRPVPLQDPTPQSSDRTVADVIGSVQGVEQRSTPSAPATASTPAWAPSTRATPAPARDEQRPAGEQALPDDERSDVPLAPAGFVPSTSVPSSADEPDELDPAAVEQATSADGSPDAIEPLGQAAAHAEEPRVHRSTWAAPGDAEPTADDPGADLSDDDRHSDDLVAEVIETSASDPAADPSATTPEVFPLSLDEDDTNEVPVVRAVEERSGAPESGVAAVEPKPVTTAFDAPAGHWSVQGADQHDAEVHDPETGERRVANANTNAIVMPNSALSDVTGALNATGEVIITGSIDLPKSLSSTGSHRPIDGAEVDRLLEQQDEQPETDASPVRASRAVSSHTSTRQVVLAAAKPKESKAPIILGLTAGGLGVAAIVVVVVALVTTHTFG